MNDPPDLIACPDGYPQRLDVTTDNLDEFPYLNDVVACTDFGETSTYLANNADVAWTLHTPEPRDVDQLDDNIEAKIFRDSAARAGSGAVLAPQTDVVVFAPPQELEWLLAPDLTAMWLIQAELMEVVREHSEEQFGELVGGRSPRRRAIVTCGFSALDIAGEAGGLIDDTDPAGQMLAALGIGSEATECAAEWRSADEAQRAISQSPPTWADNVAPLADDADFLSHADETLSRVKRIGNAALRLR